MCRLFLFAFFSLCSFAGHYVLSQRGGERVSEACLECICEAATGCNQTARCENGKCGPFGITWPFWVDAEKPVIPLDDPNSPDAWVRCVTDPVCASTTVQNYLTGFKQDCNSDGKIDCVDYASIHHQGGYGCNIRPWNQIFEARFFDCFIRMYSLN